MESLLRKLSASMRVSITIVMCFLFIFLSSWIIYAESKGQANEDVDLQLVWSTDYGEGEQVFFSKYINDNWTIPVQISDSDHFVFQAVSSVGNDGKIWVVWSRKDKNGSALQFSVYTKSRWTQSQLIKTATDNNRAVTVIVDNNNTPWIAWTGSRNSTTDVFWSRWNGHGWDRPVKAHTDNKVPDFEPRLILDDSGSLILSWRTFVNGKYVTVSKIWDGQNWQTVPYDPQKMTREKINFKDNEKLVLPDFIKERHQATLFIKRNDCAGSIPLANF